MDDDQEEKNQSESFTKQQMRKGKDKLKDEGKKQAKRKLLKLIFSNPKVAFILATVLFAVIFIVVLISGAAYLLNIDEENTTNAAKAQAIEISYSGEGDVIGTNEDLDKEVNKIIIKPNSSKNGYEIAYNDDEDNLFIIGKKIEEKTQISSNKFSDFELGVLGALMDNGANLEYYTEEQLHCFPAFIKAEACTQFLDLRSNIDANNYKPAELKYLKENEVPGVVLIQRTNTQNNNPITLTYVPEGDFDKKLEGNSESEKDWLMEHFTVNEKGDLKIATWTMNEITVDNPQNYPENLPDEEKEKSTGKVYYFDKIEIPYSEYIKEYTMPFEFLVQLLVYTKDADFCMELVEDYIIKSKIVINIQEEETDTHITEVRDYTVYSKDEKRIDYKLSPLVDIESKNDLLLRNGNPNVDDKGKKCTNYYDPNLTTVNITRDYVETSYSWEVIEADTWLIHMTKTYLPPEEKPIKDDTENIKNIPEDYTMIDEQNITDTTENAKDNNVKMFKDEREQHYKDLITIPKVKLDIGTKYVMDTFSHQFVEIPGDNKISIIPEDKIQSPWTSKEYNENESLPSTINITTKENGDLPQITYPFTLNNNKYTTEWTKDKIAECLVTRLNIKKFERIDLKEKITTKITKWEADQNPVTEIHIYATKDGQPGRGQINGDNYEKFLIAYDNNEDARDEIESISDWLFEAMEENEKTVELVDYIKWILYLYDGTNYGVTEAPDTSIFESEKFTEFNGGISGFDAIRNYIHYWEGVPPKNSSETKYIVFDDEYGNLTVGWGVLLKQSSETAAAKKLKKAGYSISLNSEIDIDIVDELEIDELSNCIEYVRKAGGGELTEYQIGSLVSRCYQMGKTGAMYTNKYYSSAKFNFYDSFKKYWGKDDTESNYKKAISDVIYNHDLYKNYMGIGTYSNGQESKGLINRRESEWKLFMTGYDDSTKTYWSSSSSDSIDGINLYNTDGTVNKTEKDNLNNMLTKKAASIGDYRGLEHNQCTWWAAIRADEYLKKYGTKYKQYPTHYDKRGNFGNGGVWYDKNKDYGWFEYGSEPRANSIVSWGHTKNGHVAYVEAVDYVNKKIYVSHAGSGKSWYGITEMDWSGNVWTGWGKDINGYIYLDRPK